MDIEKKFLDEFKSDSEKFFSCKFDGYGLYLDPKIEKQF